MSSKQPLRVRRETNAIHNSQLSRPVNLGPDEQLPALALSAGGARGAYQIGCWKAFVERGLSFTAVAGSSIGALNGAFVCQGDVSRAWSFWEEIAETGIAALDYATLRKMAVRLAVDLALLFAPVPNLRTARLLKYALAAMRAFSARGSLGTLRRYGLVDLEKLAPVLDRYLDFERVSHSSVTLFVTAYSPPELRGPLGRSIWFKLQDLDEDMARKVIAASISLPLIFPPVELNGASLRDGGISEWVPIRPLFDHGFRRIILVGTKPGFGYNARSYPGCQVLIVKPGTSLGRFPISTLRFTGEAVDRWMKLGYEDASRTLEESGGW
ncbi:MAG: patatin-like phospholipase family protein [Desulfomonile sp.]|nr:patatin-like phospholipase family protein [Desulfomonile sp.]